MSDQPDPGKKHSETTLNDVKQLGIWAAIGSLGYVFWVVGGMEMIERLAYYGVRAVATIYATRAESEGGLGVTMATFGWLLFTWNLIQSLVPIFTGGISESGTDNIFGKFAAINQHYFAGFQHVAKFF